MTIPFEMESLAALRAVSSGEELMAQPIERVVTGTKESSRDIVTNLDLLIESYIRTILEETGHPILSEEAYASRPELPSLEAPFWAVDPIDGTVNFTNGMPFYGISAGLWDGRAFTVGAVALPAFKEIFFTHGDEAAFLNGKRLQAKASPLGEALIGASFPGKTGPTDPPHYEIFRRVNENTRGCLRLGSAASLICLTACNRLQGAYGFRAKLWDVGGALAVASRAGCEVWISLHRGEPTLDYVVAGPGVLEPLRNLLGIDSSLQKGKS